MRGSKRYQTKERKKMTQNKLIYYDPDLFYTTKCFRGNHKNCSGGGYFRKGKIKFKCDCDCHFRSKQA